MFSAPILAHTREDVISNSTSRTSDSVDHQEKMKFAFSLITSVTMVMFALAAFLFIFLFLVYGCTQRKRTAAVTREVVLERKECDRVRNL